MERYFSPFFFTLTFSPCSHFSFQDLEYTINEEFFFGLKIPDLKTQSFGYSYYTYNYNLIFI